ncbi:hypothetical protein DAI22_10g116801 [Oryza sativa Japonica Group]|nr:hypothetical protein DAI22_10g116801 [Oryza sativa Japonica Group]
MIFPPPHRARGSIASPPSQPAHARLRRLHRPRAPACPRRRTRGSIAADGRASLHRVHHLRRPRAPARLRQLPWTRVAPSPPPTRSRLRHLRAGKPAPRSPLSRVAISASIETEAVSALVWFGCMHMHLIPILRV